jgi:ankyrin repeat protein
MNIFDKIIYQILLLVGSMPMYGMDIGEQLRRAVMVGNFGEIKRLIEGVPEWQRKSLINQKDDELGVAALHYAFIHAGPCRNDVIRYLLELGADVDCQDRWNWTPLLYATYFGCPGAVKLLLEAGARSDLKYILRKTTLKRSDARIELIIEYKTQQAAHSIAPRIGEILALSTRRRLAAESPLGLLPQYLLKEIAILAAQAEARAQIQKEVQDERFITRNKRDVSSKVCIVLSLVAWTAAMTLYSLWLLNKILPEI